MVQMWPSKPYVHLHDKWGNSIGSTRDWQIVPGGFDYIIFNDGNMVKVKNCKEGKIEFRGVAGADDESIVQSIISQMTAGQSLLVTCDITLQNNITFNVEHGTLIVTGTINGAGVTVTGAYTKVYANEVRNAQTAVDLQGKGLHVSVGKIVDCGVGVKFTDTTYSIVNINEITAENNALQGTGLLFDAGSGQYASENRVVFGVIHNLDTGIHFTSNSGMMEGNTLIGGVYYNKSYGLKFDSGGDSTFTTFIGGLDQGDAGGQNLVDGVGNNIYILYYVDFTTVSIPSTSTIYYLPDRRLLNLDRIQLMSADGSSQSMILNNGTMELTSSSGYIYFDFKDDPSKDFDARILYDNTNKEFNFYVGGAGSTLKALKLSKDGHLVSPRVYRGDYGGNFANFTPPTAEQGKFFFAEDTNSTSPAKRLYVCLDGSTWSYVNLT